MYRLDLLFGDMKIGRVIQKYGILVCGPLLFILLYLWPVNDNPRSSICMMRRTTGIPCPTCGMTRSLASLAKGQFSQSLDYHPFGILVAGLLCAGWLYVSWYHVRGKVLPRISPWILLAGLLGMTGLFTGYWVYHFVIPLLQGG
jgi:hypothetical protein